MFLDCDFKVSDAKQRKTSLQKAVEKAKVGRQDTVRMGLNCAVKIQIHIRELRSILHLTGLEKLKSFVCLCRKKEALC